MRGDTNKVVMEYPYMGGVNTRYFLIFKEILYRMGDKKTHHHILSRRNIMASDRWSYHSDNTGLIFTSSSYYFQNYVKEPIKVSLPENMSFDEFQEKISYLYKKKHGEDIPAVFLNHYMVGSYEDMIPVFDRALKISLVNVTDIIFIYTKLSDDMKIESLFAIMDILGGNATYDDRARAAIASMNALGVSTV